MAMKTGTQTALSDRSPPLPFRKNPGPTEVPLGSVTLAVGIPDHIAEKFLLATGGRA
jgi:hypothetical protein